LGCIQFKKTIIVEGMFEKFLNGFITFIPFYYRNNNDIKCYPDDIFVNDWKIIGRIITQSVRKSKIYINNNGGNGEEL
jgi:hypothetical protein